MQFTPNPASAIGSLSAAALSPDAGGLKDVSFGPCNPLDGGAGENCLALSPPIALEFYMMALTCREDGIGTCPTPPFMSKWR